MAKVLFAQEIFFPFQGIARLSAYLKQKGHKVILVIGDEKTVLKKVQTENPDLIAFSVLTPYRNHMLASVSTLKQAGVKTPIIAGGYDITFLPQVIEHCGLDIVCRGEGEEPLAELCDCIDAKRDYSRIPNLWVKKEDNLYKNRMRPWSSDLDKFPFDDRDIYFDYDNYFKIVPFTQVLAGRGCPYLCRYCFNHGYRKIYEAEGSRGYCKLRSVENVIEEIMILKNKYKARYLFFNDSTLAYNKQWLFHFLEEYKERIKLPFSINAVMSEVDEALGRKLKESQYCILVRLALETGNQEYRMNVLNKKITTEQLIRGAGILSKNNIRYSIAMMFGLPGETLDLAWQTIRMAKRISAKNTVHAVNIFKPFPGLDITEYGINLGQYKKEDVSAFQLPKALEKNEILHIDKSEAIKNLALGSRDLCFYQNYRTDKEGQLLLRLSRFSHLAIRLPFLRPLIKLLIKFPDNLIYRFIWMATEGLLNIKAHANVPLSFFIKYSLFYSSKKIR
ncbi:MAG: B12-binding domain-containing radical SAM protein [Candidatus Omnitrophica bacterium]|nr:B12-binding domain-containing radical SAM protein [Candidatus Omnitrophota bacterium]